MTTSKETLSADIDLVKEVEQLRIKQKLLISALEKEKSEEKNQQLADISSKIDFIVEIFKNASNEDSQKEEDVQTTILEKLDDVLSTVEKRFDDIDAKIAKLNQQPQKQPQQDSNTTQNTSSNDKSSLPPPPQFYDQVKQKEASQQEEKKEASPQKEQKKKGFFSK